MSIVHIHHQECKYPNILVELFTDLCKLEQETKKPKADCLGAVYLAAQWTYRIDNLLAAISALPVKRLYNQMIHLVQSLSKSKEDILYNIEQTCACSIANLAFNT